MNATASDAGDSAPYLPSPQLLTALESEVQRDHGDRPPQRGDHARIWRHAALEGVELFQGSFRSYRFARHFHRIPAIGIVESGSMRSYLRGETHILGPGTVLLLNPGEIHAPAPAGSSGWSFRMIYLDDKLFSSISSNISMHGLRFHQPFVQDKELASRFLGLHLELEEEGDRLRFESLLVSIFSRLAERHPRSVPSFAETKSDMARIDRARQYLEAHYNTNPSIDQLAALSSLSASHFLRLFRDTVGLTPHAYLTQLRIERATSLLLAGAPLVDVASRAGFVDQSHFTRQFKRILGVTPGQYAQSPKRLPQKNCQPPSHSARH